MQISTISICVGDYDHPCNANCKFCISKATYKDNHGGAYVENLDSAMTFAVRNNISTAIITSKGEPTLLGDESLNCLVQIIRKSMPIIELQTNGIRLNDKKKLEELKNNGLKTLALSCVSYEPIVNNEIMGTHKNFDVLEVARKAVEVGLMVRLCPVIVKGGIDNLHDFDVFFKHTQDIGIHQVTLRRVGLPVDYDESDKKTQEVIEWINKNKINGFADTLEDNIKRKGTKLMRHPWGAVVYDYEGVGICVVDCLSYAGDTDILRNVILFPDGHLRYSWDLEGAILF